VYIRVTLLYLPLANISLGDVANSKHFATQSIGNESVPIQLAQCWFPGLVPMLKYKYIFLDIIYGSNCIKQHSETVTV